MRIKGRLLATALLLNPGIVMAESIVLKKNTSTIQEFSMNLINGTILPLLSILALASLVWGGLNIIMAGGDDAKVTKGRTIITYAIVGILLIFCAYAIINLLGKTIWQSFNFN